MANNSTRNNQTQWVAGPGNTDSLIVDKVIDRISIFPNPTAGMFNLNFNYLNEKNIEITVLNSLGKTVFYDNMGKIGIGQVKIDLIDEAEGMYMIKIISDNDLSYKKIILSK